MTARRYRELRMVGLSRRRIREAVDNGSLGHPGRDRYLAPDDDLVLTAVTAGASLACVSALAHHGVWTLEHGLHLRVRGSGSSRGIAAERVHVSGRAEPSGLDDLLTALIMATRCLPIEESVAAVDSALNGALLTEAEVRDALRRSRGGGRVLARIDPAAQSGLESLVRVRLRDRGIRVRTQVHVAGVGAVDLLIGDRLVIELDGDRWHSTPAQRENDRRRDSALVALGFLVMRFGYSRIVRGWASAEREILTIVRADRHRWRRGPNRTGVNPGA